MGDQREARVGGLDLLNVAAARRDFREGRVAPVDVLHVSRGLEGEHAIVAVADLQHGLIKTEQLTTLGLTASSIHRRAESGRMTRAHRGVLLAGRGTLTRRAQLLAAALAVGHGAVVSHRSALELWRALPVATGPVHVTAPRHRRSAHHGVSVHQSAALSPADLCAIDQIPLTAPARSLLDFAWRGRRDELEAALNELRGAKLLRPADLDDLSSRTIGHCGWKRLNALLTGDDEAGFSRGEAELRMLRLIRDASMPSPLRNACVDRWEVDFLWPRHRLIVEIDGFAFHSGRRAFERDRRKQAELQELGYEVLRFTWRQITGQPLWVVARLASRLEARRGP